MRIWIINHYAAPPSQAGITRHYNLARQLKLLGHDVIIIASNYNHFIRTFMSVEAIDNPQTVPFKWIPTPAYKGNAKGRFWNMLVFSWRILKKKYLPTTGEPDVIIGSSPHLFAAFAAQLLAKRLKKPFVFEVRDIWPQTIVDLDRLTNNNPLVKIMRGIEKYLYRKADRVISVLPSVKEYFLQNGVKEKSILWLPNSIDIDLISKDTIPVKNTKFTLLYAGLFGLANDLDILIRAGKILQDKNLSSTIRICVMGEGPEKNNLKELARSLNVTIVEFFDSVPKNQIYSRLAQADGFLMLLKNLPVFRWGISPNKLYDYMIMARPIIFAVDTPFNPIQAAKAGITVKPSDPDALATAIYTLSQVPQAERDIMGASGREYVLKNHDVRNLAKALEKFLEDLIIDSNQKLNPQLESAR